MNDQYYHHEPLTAEGKEFLLHLYRKRLRWLLFGQALVMIWAFRLPQDDDRNYSRSDNINYEDTNGQVSKKRQLLLLKVVLLEIVAVGSGVYTYRKKVLPLKQDAESGIVEMVPFAIKRKQHFARTDKYYVSIDAPGKLHHEISRGQYDNCEEGDTIYIYRGIKSKLFFEKDGRHQIM